MLFADRAKIVATADITVQQLLPLPLKQCARADVSLMLTISKLTSPRHGGSPTNSEPRTVRGQTDMSDGISPAGFARDIPAAATNLVYQPTAVPISSAKSARSALLGPSDK